MTPKREYGSCLAIPWTGFYNPGTMKMAARTVLLTIISTLSLTGAVQAETSDKITSPVTRQKVASYLESHHPETVHEFLLALPDELLQNATLVRESQSLQQATPGYPRQVFFGSDARFLMGVSSLKSDPLYSVIEFADYNSSEGVYRAGSIHFSHGAAPHLENSPKTCQICHGATWRPIWGEYETWPGVYGNNVGKIEKSEIPGFMSYLSAKPTEPNLQPLDLVFNTTSKPPTALLKNRHYRYPNTVFGFVVGGTVATGAYVRIRQSAAYEKLRWGLLAPIMGCSKAQRLEIATKMATLYKKELAGNPAFAAKYGSLSPIASDDSKQLGRYRLLGVDPASELIRKGISDNSESEGDWNEGFGSLYDFIAAHVLEDVIDTDPTMHKIFSGRFYDSFKIAMKRLQMWGPERVAAIKSENEFFWYQYFGNLRATINDLVPRKAEACDIVVQRVKGI